MIDFKFYYEPVFDTRNIFDEHGNLNKNSHDWMSEGAYFAEDPFIPITERKFVTRFFDRHLIWARNSTIEKNLVEDHGDHVKMFQTMKNIVDFQPASKEEEYQKAKDNARFVVTKGVLGTGYWFRTNKLFPALKLQRDTNADKSSKEYNDAEILINTIIHGPREATINVLKTKTDKPVEVLNNDVAIDNKKIGGGTEHTNETGHYQRIAINMYSYNDFISKSLTGDQYHRKMSRKFQGGITSITEEIPNLDVNKFILEWYEEFRGILNRVSHLVD